MLRVEIASAGMVAEVSGADEDGTYRVQVTAPRVGRFVLPDGAELHAWPVTLREKTSAQPVDAGRKVLTQFSRLGVESLTRFFAFRLRLREGRKKAHESCFVLNLPMKGEPARRKEAVLRSLLKNRRGVLRYLLLLLASDADVTAGLLSSSGSSGAYLPGGSYWGEEALFESLVRCLDRDPARLDQVARVIDELKSAANGKSSLLPAEFDRIWEPVWAARKGKRT